MKIPQFKNLIFAKVHPSKELNGNTINIYRDWKISLSVSFVILLGLILWSLYLLEEIRNDELSKTVPNNTTVRSAVNEKKLEAVSNIFLEKAKRHEELKTTPLPVSDPSR